MPTILVIDDNEDFRAYMTALLDRQGYRVIALESARKLGEVVREHQIDAVITDLYMPQVDGLEVVTFFQRYDSQLPVFGVTGSAGLGDSVCMKAMNAFGALEVFTKPLDAAKLISSLNRALKVAPERSENQPALEFEDDTETIFW